MKRLDAPALGALLVAALVGLATFAASAGGPPRLAELPAFSLTAQDGSAFTGEALKGRAWVADFIFTRCGAACPAMTEQMGRLQEGAPASLIFVSFTVDPEFDTPGVLARYAADHRARAGWWFVTGAKEALYALSTRGFKLMAMEAPRDEARGEGPFLHSSKFVLVDPLGSIRGYYDSEDPGERRLLLRDAALVGPYGRLPRVNASLNATSAVLLLCGYLFIRAGRRSDHRNCMLAALGSSAVFLTCYLVYHAHQGSVRFPGDGVLRSVYLGILVSHTVLAIAIVPLVALAVVRAARGRFEGHKRVARIAFPLWTYVSVTGVIVYWMLYRL